MRRACLIMALGVVIAGCGGSGATGPAAKDSAAVYEAVFRYRLQKQPKEVEAYLAVDGKDAPAELLEKLQKDWPNVKPASAAPKDKGLREYAEDLQWTGNGAAAVKAGHSFPTKFGNEGYFGTHHLLFKNGRWEVDRVTDEVMS